MICINPTENGEVKKPINPFVQQKCCPCLANCLLPLANSLLVASTISINIQEPKKKMIYKIFHNANLKSECLIFLMECTLCNKPYAEKA